MLKDAPGSQWLPSHRTPRLPQRLVKRDLCRGGLSRDRGRWIQCARPCRRRMRLTWRTTHSRDPWLKNPVQHALPDADLDDMISDTDIKTFKPFFYDTSPNTVSIHPMVLKSLLFQYCSRRLKNCSFHPSQRMAILQLSSSKRTPNRNTPFTTEARLVRQTHSDLLLVATVDAYSRAGARRRAVISTCRRLVCHAEVALQLAHLRVSACTDRLVSPCHRPPVSSLRPRIGLVGRTMAPSQHQTAPTPRRCRRSKDKKTKQNERSGLRHLGRFEVIFVV